jgi:glycosyltransferase involved in cell wall biosynthesis
LRVLLSALACEPGRGTELEVGYRTLLAAAAEHEVWVLTDATSVPKIEAALEGHPARERIHLHGIRMWRAGMPLERVTIPQFHRLYDSWQRRAATLAVELDARVGFDVVHHVTLASYWTRAGVAAVGKPLVWGPVGGGVHAPPSMLGVLGARGLVEHLARSVGRVVLGRWGPARHAARRAAVTLAQNPETLHRLPQGDGRRTLSNALVVDVSDVSLPGRRAPEVMVVGRLLAWKAPLLALEAFSRVARSDVTLRFFGEGPEEERLHRRATELGLGDRVRLEGWQPRERLLGAVAGGAVLVHPALHEEAGLCIAEALSLGTPVVCLDHGGPAQVTRHWPERLSTRIAPGRPEGVVRAMAAAIEARLDELEPPATTVHQADVAFDAEILAMYREAVG